MSIWKALAIDGGGVFGLVPATALAKYKPYSIFNAFGGTSIGSACAAYYACGKDPALLPILMLEAFPDIFTAPWYRYLNPRSSKYPADGLKKFLNQTFGDQTLGQVDKPLYIMSFDFANKSPKVFASTGDQDKEVRIADAVLASVSAPTYFPPAGDFVDGGLWANCPAVATAAALTNTFRIEIDQVSLFSVGTGVISKKPTDMSGADSWGILSWAARIVDAMLEGGSVRGNAFIASELPFKAYRRWDKVQLDPDWTMDDTKHLKEISEIMGGLLNQTIDMTTYQQDFDAEIELWMKESL